MKAVVSILFEAVDPFMGCLSGKAETFCQFSNGVVAQLVIFEESLSLLSHGNTFPGYGLHLLNAENVTHVFRICVTYVSRIFCNLCL
jgi:hypothetical protein